MKTKEIIIAEMKRIGWENVTFIDDWIARFETEDDNEVLYFKPKE
ncbi:MAG: hypothetical protein ACTSU7_00020 [Candidatus Heimdallarchaeaceae archaeon]